MVKKEKIGCFPSVSKKKGATRRVHGPVQVYEDYFPYKDRQSYIKARKGAV